MGYEVKCRALALMMPWALICHPALAQNIPGTVGRDAQRIQEQQQQQAQDQAQRFYQSQNRAPSGTPAAPVPLPPVLRNGGCAAIRETRLTGVTRYAPGTFTTELARLKGSCVAVDTIDAVLHAITDRYVKDGYVTSRAFIGPQDLQGGVLTITVMEGRVAHIVSPGEGHYNRAELDQAFPEHTGDVLNLRGLEQGVDQLARLAGTNLAIDIVPGDVPTTSTVEVKDKPVASWLRASWGMNNNGAAMTGRLQQTATLDADSPWGIGDAWSFYYTHDAEKNPLVGSGSAGGFVSFPHGWWTLSLAGGVSDYHSVLWTSSGLGFVTNGQNWNANATIDRMIHRDANSKLSISAGLAIIDTTTFIENIELQTGSYRIVTANVAAHWQKRLGHSLLIANFGYARGLGILGAYTVDTGPGGATGLFDVLNADASLQSRFAVGSSNFTNTLTLRGQWGLNNLFPVNVFTLGGVSTVRGFRDDGISGRTGALLREQLNAGICDIGKGSRDVAMHLSSYIAYDAGTILPNSYSIYERGLIHSASVGARIEGRHVQSDIGLAIPISAPAFVGHKATEFTFNVKFLL